MLGLTPIQVQSLLFVQETKPFATMVGNLARLLGATHASVVGTVDGLVARGYLVRTVAEDDRRVTLLRLTDDGIRACVRIREQSKTLDQAVSAMTAEERAGLDRGVGALMEQLGEGGYAWLAHSCHGCMHFQRNKNPASETPHRCALLQVALAEDQLDLECPEFISGTRTPR